MAVIMVVMAQIVLIIVAMVAALGKLDVNLIMVATHEYYCNIMDRSIGRTLDNHT